MSLSTAQAMGVARQQQQQPGGVAVGHVPQQPDMGLGPNRYVPPTFNWGRGGLDGRQPNYQQMDWNQMQAFYMPQHTNTTFTNPYMQQLQGMLGQFSNQYGSPNRQPMMPNFGSYNPGFGGPTSFYDQSLQDWGRSAIDMQRNMGQGPQGQGEYRMYVGGGDTRGGGRGDMHDTYLRYRQNNPGEVDPGFNIDGPGQRAPTLSRDQYTQWLRDTESGRYDNMYPTGGRGGYPQMPQFNPYMLARNNLGGMDFNQMFDPRFAMLFGMGGLGSLRPQGFEATQPQQPPSTANGQKPLAVGGGG